MPEPSPAPAPPPLSHAHHAPPPHVRDVHKKYQKASVASLPQDEFILNFSAGEVSGYHKSKLKTAGRVPRRRAERVFKDFEIGIESQKDEVGEEGSSLEDDTLIYEHSSVPGDYLAYPSCI